MKLTKRSVKRLTLGDPIVVPMPKVWEIRFPKKYPGLVVTKVDRKLGRITLKANP